jgi:hypothetical protein
MNFRAVGRMKDGKLVGTVTNTLGSKPDSVVLRGAGSPRRLRRRSLVQRPNAGHLTQVARVVFRPRVAAGSDLDSVQPDLNPTHPRVQDLRHR